jgi:hypothetical protein
MNAGSQVDDAPQEPAGGGSRPRGRIAAAYSGSRDLVRIVYRDPEHVPERLTLHASDRLAGESLEWAQAVRRARPGTPRATIADELRSLSAKVARIDGAIAGTPFFIALVPGYVAYLWQEGRMAQRTAALYGRDPGALRTAAELLALRGVHASVEQAEKALIATRDTPMPDSPETRRSLRTWVHSAYLLLVFGGFLSPSGNDDPQPGRSRLRTALGLAIGAAVWVTTWVLPVTFMIAMAWGCESHTRPLGLRTLALNEGDPATTKAAIAKGDRRRDRGHDKRRLVRSVALALSVLVPIGFVAFAGRITQSAGFTWLAALGALVAFSLVVAVAVLAARH